MPVVTFTWQGGEPGLTGIDFFRKALSFQKKFAGGRQIENAFQTNGTLIDEEWCRFFSENSFLVGISVDGPREIHDRHRKNRSGMPSFDKVMHAVSLLKINNVEFNTLTVVHNDNASFPLEIYSFLKSAGSTFMQFIPVVERFRSASPEDELKWVDPSSLNAQVTEWSVKPYDYGRFLITIFDEWVRNDVGGIFVQLFDVTLANWVGEPPGLCVFNETCGNAMVLEHNGDLYSCDHFVYPDYLLGNIGTSTLLEMSQAARQRNFGQSKLNDLPGFCIGCEYRFACHGECPKHRFEKTPDGAGGLNYLCGAYKRFFSYVHPYMQYMGDELAAKRPPANVMEWARRFAPASLQTEH
jgi:uncharacterized protein